MLYLGKNFTANFDLIFVRGQSALQKVVVQKKQVLYNFISVTCVLINNQKR